MLNTFVSGPLSLPTLPDSQMSHLNSVMSRADSSMTETLEGAVKPLNSDLISTSGIQHEKSEYMPNNVGLQPYSGQLEMLMPNKRKATTEPLPDKWGLQKMTSNKRVAPVGSNAKGLNVSVSQAPNKKSMSNLSRVGASGKKLVQLESPVNKSQTSVTKKNAQPEVSPKIQAESCDSVRAKLRESLASALALVSQQREGSSDGKMKTGNEVEAKTQEGLNVHKPLVCESSSEAANVELVEVQEPVTDCILAGVCSDDKKSYAGTYPKETCREDTHTWSFMGTEFQSNPILSGEDTLFGDGLFFKDELLQGNGLSWDVENIRNYEVMHGDVIIDEKEKPMPCPESLALEIETELFKLFGGVNKKYKEKGRSLLFNLKDRNNPELRERVMSGEIPPDRLCSMTAEELASKELSEWRIAKAEALDQMKVLPDSDVNMRRLVKKTHKGEYQVDFETDMGPSEDISPEISVPSHKRSKVNRSNAGRPKADPTKVEQYDQCEITIPSDGTDMQGLMVDDMKDLPPIVSLDEFMESLNNEPPFENLPVDSETTTLEMDKERLDVGFKSRSPVLSPKQSVKIASPKMEEVGVESKIVGANKKLADTHRGLDIHTVHLPKQEYVWEGLLQLNISSTANFVALVKSGEKANTKEWAESFDIKGRVRLDAFDKFLQALPMSRSRSIMVSHFVLKEGSTDSERSSLLELVDSYITDERLGFAEPAPGVELYLCPPRSKTVDMIINHLPKSYTEKLNNIDDGLIGIVVWRKVQITPPAISPNSLSHQKQMTKNHTGGHNAVNDMNRNYRSLAPSSGPSPPSLNKPPQPDEEDDVPPGFGPPGHREEDDLPEFNFSGGPNLPSSHSNLKPVPSRGTGSRQHNLLRAPVRQVDQMRELIQKYGQNGTNGGGSGIPTEPWNDDDDDIPEWQPQASHPGPPAPAPQPVQNPALAPHMTYQTFQRPPWPPVAQQMQPLQPPMSVQQQGTWCPYGISNVGSLPNGQFNGAPSSGHLARDWRPNNGANNQGF